MAAKATTERKGNIAKRPAASSPLVGLHQEVDRLFDTFMSDFQPWRSGLRFWHDDGELVPRIDVSETDKEIQVNADLPGMDEKDIEVTLSNGVLTIKGERKAEKEEKNEEKSFHKVERAYGLYRRSIALPADVQEDKIKAEFAKGVLKIRMPKSASSKSKVKKISVKAA